MTKELPDREICSRVAEQLKNQRLAKGLSLTRTAEMAALSRQMVAFVEQSERIPTLETLLRLSRALDLYLPDVIAQAIKGA